jgi:PUL domain.
MDICFTDILFPVLDVIRLAIRNAAINSALCSGDMGDQLIGRLQHFLLSDSVAANQMLSIRILCNMLSHPDGEALALRHKDFLLSVLFQLTPPFSKQIQVNICGK